MENTRECVVGVDIYSAVSRAVLNNIGHFTPGEFPGTLSEITEDGLDLTLSCRESLSDVVDYVEDLYAIEISEAAEYVPALARCKSVSFSSGGSIASNCPYTIVVARCPIPALTKSAPVIRITGIKHWAE